MKLLKYEDYKDFLNDLVATPQSSIRKKDLADAAGCQRAYLSQVLNGLCHLTPEQGLKIAQFLKFNEIEKEYFFHLLSKCRTSDYVLLQFHQSKLLEIKKTQDSITKRMIKTENLESDLYEYYSNWFYSAIHMLLTIPKFRRLDLIANRLNLSAQLVEHVLVKLKEWKLCDKKDQEWIPTKKSVHLSKEHPMISNLHRNWRLRNTLKPDEDQLLNIQYTSTCTMSLKDALKCKDLILECIEQQRKIVETSPEEELFSLCIDFVKV